MAVIVVAASVNDFAKGLSGMIAVRSHEEPSNIRPHQEISHDSPETNHLTSFPLLIL